MAYPEDLLSEGEKVVIHKHPHWKMLLLPYLVLVITLGVGIWLAILVRDASSPWDMVGLIAIGVVALVLIVWLFLVPFVRWRTTHFIVTSDRVMAREGVINRTGTAARNWAAVIRVRRRSASGSCSTVIACWLTTQ